MRIEWKITKKRGNLRPVLRYSVELEEHEKALALPTVAIVSSIPQPEEPRQDYCYPGCLERAADAAPGAFYTLEAPSHKGHTWTRTLLLPWREDNAYPEVAASFLRLREALEKELERAYNSAPLLLNGAERTSPALRRVLAPGVLGARLLRAAAGGRENAAD
ncbi:hypothetical protein [Desulfovibrio legallii]|uniref:Uncharacterized protein n=1 Tax=Desulfovibrio legallii TaxID=571438 RepID=A0A1G7N0W3_9BACT|nr:hypothetical protein [Desulfovibrio legallii]SDF66960.1 hypothetical protein SAMN05192586_11035 [Desulfovibrio legallii]